jgi:hypothetical protein
MQFSIMKSLPGLKIKLRDGVNESVRKRKGGGVLESIHACLREARGRAVYCTMMPNSVSPAGPSPV